MKVRVRFGITLSWPIKNAGILVFYVSQENWRKIKEGVDMARPFLPAYVNERFVCEAS